MAYQAFPAASSGGGGFPEWLAEVNTFVLGKVSTLTALVMDSENQDSLIYTLSATGTAGATVLAGSVGGVIQLNTGTTAGSIGKAINLNGTSKALVANGRTSKYAIVVEFKVQTAPLAGSAGQVITNMSDEATADSYIGIRVATSATNFTTVVGGAAHDTGVAFSTAAYHTMAQIGDGTNIKWYYDTVLIDTVAQSGAANAAAHLQVLANNGDQVVNNELRIDKIAVYTENP